jgi:cytochrome c
MADPVPVDITGPDGAKMTGDPAAGEKTFKQCQVCHTIEPGKNKVGPSLYGVIGRTAGSVEGYNYSKANKESGRVWTEQAIFEYLENPRAEGTGIPGTKMAFVGLKKPEDRANVIAYLQESYKAATAGEAPAPAP